MVTDSDPFICLHQGTENNMTASAIIEDLLWIAIAAVLVISALVDRVLICYENEAKRIKRELESLEALIKDYDQLVEEGNKVESQACRFWESELDLAGIHLQLSEAENNWIKSVREVAREAKDCISNYDKQRGGVLYSYTPLFRLIPIIDVVRQIDAISKMLDQLKNNDEGAKTIYKSMESSRSKNRSLLDQYTIQENGKSVQLPPAQQQKQRKPSTSIDELMKKGKDLFSGMEERLSIYMLLPLHAFLKDLSQLQLETETEKLWKREAEDLIAEAEGHIGNFSSWVSIFSSIRLLKNNIPIVTTQFRKRMHCIFTKFDDLLERKNKYKFDFIDRAGEKSIFPSAYQNTDDTAITSDLERICRKLEQSPEEVNEIKSLCDDLKKMRDELQRREETMGRNACLDQIKSMAQEVDHLLHSFSEGYMNEHELNRLEQIKKAMERLQQITNVCNIERKESREVGLENDIRKLVSKLTTNSDNNNNQILPIVGMTGVGKTTLAKAIYFNKTVVKHFPIRFLVTVTQGAVWKAQGLLMKEDGTNAQTLYVSKVRDHLQGKPSLVVLDNVSKKEDLDKLKELLSGITNESKIVLTTRFKNVALHAESSTPHQIRLLTEEKSWALFQKVVTLEPKLESEVEKLARKVVGRCEGLPLAIFSLGCLLSANGVTEKNLHWVLRRINQGHNQTPWLQAWESNSQGLSETMRNCLSCFTIFPVDFEIPARRLVNLWVAEGLGEQNKGFDDNQETPEDTAERYLEQLRECNMIQVVAQKSNGKIKTCRLPSMLRELILRDSHRASLRQYSSTHSERRFAYHSDDRGLDANSANVLSKKGIPLSVLFFDKQEGSKPGENIGNILSIGMTSGLYMQIRVLDLERVFRPQLPETLSKLIHLNYLGLRWTYLEEFPSFISKLVNLETLDVKHTCIRVLPSSIWKLKKLRKLYLNQDYRNGLEGKVSGNFQENLHTLWGVFICGGSPLLRDLHRLKNLRNLRLAFQLTEIEQETLLKLIVQLNQLHSLRLRSIDEMGDPKPLRLNNMSKLERLSSLHLFGNLEVRLCMSRFPQNLIDLTLSASNLSDDPMPQLKKMPKLESLCLYADSYRGKSMVCTRGSFLQLRVLRFWNLRDLEEWKVEEGAMPSLMELETRSCKKLAVPTGLKHLKTLLMIKLHDMPKEFTEEIFKTKRTFFMTFEIIDD